MKHTKMILLATFSCVLIIALAVFFRLHDQSRKSRVSPVVVDTEERVAAVEKAHESGEDMEKRETRIDAVEASGAGNDTQTLKPVVPGTGASRELEYTGHEVAPESPPEPIAEGESASLMEAYRRQSNAILRREALRRWAMEDRRGILAVAEFAVNDPNPTVILQALDILARLGERSSMPVLVEVLRKNLIRDDGHDLPIREAAIRAMGQCGDASLVPLLLEELAKREDFSYNNAIVESLGKIGDASALAAIDLHLQRLESMEPTESIAMFSWRESLRIAVEARNRIINRGEQ